MTAFLIVRSIVSSMYSTILTVKISTSATCSSQNSVIQTGFLFLFVLAAWDLSSLTRDWTWPLQWKHQILINHWTPGNSLFRVWKFRVFIRWSKNSREGNLNQVCHFSFGFAFLFDDFILRHSLKYSKNGHYHLQASIIHIVLSVRRRETIFFQQVSISIPQKNSE